MIRNELADVRHFVRHAASRRSPLALSWNIFCCADVRPLLKRGAGVQLGLLLSAFLPDASRLRRACCFTAYKQTGAITLAAAADLVSTALVVAVSIATSGIGISEKRKQTPIPHFLRESLRRVIFLIALLFCSQCPAIMLRRN